MTRTALLVLAPGAEPLLDAARAVAPAAVRPLPAHVSLLYPGPPADTGITGLPVPTSAVLDTVLREEAFTAIAVPSLEPVAQRCRERWPWLIPYGGRFGPAPAVHLTLTLGATPAEEDAVLAAVRPLLPLRTRLTGPHLAVLSDGGWTVSGGGRPAS